MVAQSSPTYFEEADMCPSVWMQYFARAINRLDLGAIAYAQAMTLIPHATQGKTAALLLLVFVPLDPELDLFAHEMRVPMRSMSNSSRQQPLSPSSAPPLIQRIEAIADVVARQSWICSLSCFIISCWPAKQSESSSDHRESQAADAKPKMCQKWLRKMCI